MARPRKVKVDPFAADVQMDESKEMDASLLFGEEDEAPEIELPDFAEEAKAQENKPVAPSMYAKKGDQARKIVKEIEEGRKTYHDAPDHPEFLTDLVAQGQGYKKSKNIKFSGMMGEDVQKDMQRVEEIQAELVRKKGRYIQGSDDIPKAKTLWNPNDPKTNPANPYIASQSRMVTSIARDVSKTDGSLKGDLFAIVDGGKAIRSEGGTLKHGILDTNAGAPEAPVVSASDNNDPRSENFMVCVNHTCRYRETCMRYRLKDKRSNKAVFFPEDCRADGIYMNVDDVDMKAITPMRVLEPKSAPRPF